MFSEGYLEVEIKNQREVKESLSSYMSENPSFHFEGKIASFFAVELYRGSWMSTAQIYLGKITI